MSDCDAPGLQIVVLAAGFSTRLGRPKSLASIRGMSLLRRTVAVLQKVTRRRIIVVVPPRATRIRTELRGYEVAWVVNARRSRGLSSSVVLGLRATRCSSGTLFLPVDLPHLSRADIARLISRWCAGKRRVAANSVAGRASTPLILPKFLYQQAQRISGDMGFRELVAGLPPGQRIIVDLRSAARDVDTPQDLEDARARSRGRRGHSSH
jgi:molybdenum cofactor cytidylyltransferase